VKVLIIGAGGQIGRALLATAPPSARILAPPRSALDLANPVAVERVVKAEAPDVVLNAAGYTAVDRAETEPDLAREINAVGADRVAAAVAGIGARLLQFSTDYVFDGRQRRPYAPGDAPNPLNVYGATKLAGERAVLARLGSQAAVIRTAWVYAAEGHNFVLTMLQQMREGNEVRVVSDQTGAPTSAISAARAAWAIAPRSDIHGIVHWTDEGTASWFDFAMAIGDEARSLGLLRRAAAVRPIASAEYPTAARRPTYSVLDCSAARDATGLTPEHWQVALRRTMEQMRPPEA
jgi:dTDP-4-dehydrorhamnose reductase